MVALLKYEFKSTGRTFLPLYATMLALSFFMGVTSSDSDTFSDVFAPLSAMSGIPFLVFFALAVATMVLTLVITIQRFSGNLLGDEGYLMFTLPVSTANLILSKLIVAASWFILSGLCLALSILIIAGGWLSAWSTIEDALKLLNPLFVQNAALYFLEYIVTVIVQSSASVLMIYASISIGHLANKRRGLMGFFAFIALLIIQSIFSSLVSSIFLSSPSFANSLDRNLPGRIDTIINISTLISIGSGVVYATVCFFITNHILKTRLNLE